MTAEERLDWVIDHRGEPECLAYLAELARDADMDTVEETLCHVWTGFYDAENDPEGLLAEQIRRNNRRMSHERKVAENRRHYAKLMEKRGARV